MTWYPRHQRTLFINPTAESLLQLTPQVPRLSLDFTNINLCKAIRLMILFWRLHAFGSAVQVFGRLSSPLSLSAPSRRLSLLPRGSSLSPGQCLVPLKGSFSPSCLPFSSPVFSRALLVVLSSLLMILQAIQPRCRHLLGPALPRLLQYTGNLVSVMLFTLPLGALSRFSGACVLLTMLHLALRSLPVCSGSHWCASALHSHSIPLLAHVGISLGSPPSSLHQWFSREVNPRLPFSLATSVTNSNHVCDQFQPPSW